ncbi:hypothetical protein K1719_005614 [Acacia pycnantha]|nr:hypothetical protein K1719_005614 [Acacia pycnantha]
MEMKGLVYFLRRGSILRDPYCRTILGYYHFLLISFSNVKRLRCLAIYTNLRSGRVETVGALSCFQTSTIKCILAWVPSCWCERPFSEVAVRRLIRKCCNEVSLLKISKYLRVVSCSELSSNGEETCCL